MTETWWRRPCQRPPAAELGAKAPGYLGETDAPVCVRRNDGIGGLVAGQEPRENASSACVARVKSRSVTPPASWVDNAIVTRLYTLLQSG